MNCELKPLTLQKFLTGMLFFSANSALTKATKKVNIGGDSKDKIIVSAIQSILLFLGIDDMTSEVSGMLVNPSRMTTVHDESLPSTVLNN